MGFFDKLKASVGIGQPKMQLTVNSTQVKAGATLAGSFTLTAQDREVPVKQFEVELIQVKTTREWSDTTKDYVNRKHNNTLVKKVIAKNDEVIKAKQSMTESFEVIVPSDVFSTGQWYSYQLKVSADIPGLDASDKAEIFVA